MKWNPLPLRDYVICERQFDNPLPENQLWYISNKGSFTYNAITSGEGDFANDYLYWIKFNFFIVTKKCWKVAEKWLCSMRTILKKLQN